MIPRILISSCIYLGSVRIHPTIPVEPITTKLELIPQDQAASPALPWYQGVSLPILVLVTIMMVLTCTAYFLCKVHVQSGRRCFFCSWRYIGKTHLKYFNFQWFMPVNNFFLLSRGSCIGVLPVWSRLKWHPFIPRLYWLTIIFTCLLVIPFILLFFAFIDV